jgi:hypothetical protein
MVIGHWSLVIWKGEGKGEEEGEGEVEGVDFVV